MDDDDSTGFAEMDPETDTDKTARRSSILKPQKPRNPFSTLDFTEANPDNTFKATRRVSFASSNFVKPFAADPEKNTIWDNTYEEEVNHTDSTKSSSDQTHGTKTSDFLNITSTYSATPELHQNTQNLVGVSSVSTSCVNIDIAEVQTESLVSLARKLRSKSMERSACKHMDFTLINKTASEFSATKEIDTENISPVSPFNKVKNVSCSSTKLTEITMDMTCITDKENVNPLINDLSLVIPRRSCLGASNTTKYFVEEDMECTRPVSSEKNVLLAQPDKADETNECEGFTENKEDVFKMNSKYFDESANAVELSTADKHGHANKSKRKTILFNETEGNMDFTIVSEADNEIKPEVENQVYSKNKTIIFNPSEDDMEFTTALPVKICNNDTWSRKKQETIHFDEFGEEMEFTNTFPTMKTPNLKQTICFEKSDCNMELTTTLVGKINGAVNSTISHVDDVEITAALSTGTIEKPFEDDMELTSTLQIHVNKSKSCDMSLTQNLHTKDLSSADSKRKHPNARETTIPTPRFPIPAQSSCNENVSSKSPLNTENNTCDNLTNNLRPLSVENVQFSDDIVDHQGIGNDISIVKRHIIDSVDDDTIKKRRIQQSFNRQDTSGAGNILFPDPSVTEPVKPNFESSKTDQRTVPVLESNSLRVETSNLQTSTLSSSNILYSEPMKLKPKASKFAPIPDLSANLDGILNLDQVSTPATSFHINLSAMSPCTEDTQQLIHATFSKPETLKILSEGAECSFNDSRKLETTCQRTDSSIKINEKTFTKSTLSKPHPVLDVSSEKLNTNFIKMSNKTPKNDKSCFLEDITPLALVPEEYDHSGIEIESPIPNYLDFKIEEQEDLLTNSSSSDFNDYSLRSRLVLTNIEKHLLPYVPETPKRNLDLSKLVKEFEENCRVLKTICKSKIHIPDLETKHEQDMEDRANASTDKDSGPPPTLGLIAPKTICERIRETAKRTKKYWDFVKTEDDYYYFYTLFGTLPFKLHIHPELGIVYSVETFTNLSDLAQPISWYQLKLLQQKLKQENLLSVLGAKFDIFALLDYIFMSMEEIINFHTEYRSLVEKYGDSHKFRMNSDYSVTFEILNVRQILFWIITVNMPLTSLVSVSKNDITAMREVGKNVNEEHIKIIAENTPKGPNFLRNFIENVDEYITRMGRRLKR